MIRDPATAIIRDCKVPNDWEQSFIVCLYKSKGNTLDRGNYRGLKQTEQARKILERNADGLIRRMVSMMTPNWLCPRKKYYRCNLCGPAAAGEIPSSEHEALYGLRGPRESI